MLAYKNNNQYLMICFSLIFIQTQGASPVLDYVETEIQGDGRILA